MINLTELLDKVKTRSLELPLEFDGTKSSEGKLRFMKKHKVKVTPDANGNGDDVFKASNIGYPEDHGYNRPKGEDAKVYEEVSIGDPSKGITLETIAKKHGMKYTPIGRGAELTHPDKGKVTYNRYGEWRHHESGAKGDSLESLNAHLSTLNNSYEPEGNQIDEIAPRWMVQNPNGTPNILGHRVKAAAGKLKANQAARGDPAAGTSIHVHEVGHKVTFLEPDPKSGKDHHTIISGIITHIKNGAATVKTSNGNTLEKPLHKLVPVLSNMANFNQKNEEFEQIDEYNLNKSMGLFAYINYYVESQSSVISDFSIKDRIKLAFTDFFSETKDKQ